MGSLFFAHSSRGGTGWQPLREHLEQVAMMASSFAEALQAQDEARIAGLLHDIGKYGERFQKRLRGETQGVDHWSPGAWLALKQFQCVAAAMAIWGHHLGLQRMDSSTIRQSLDPDRLRQQTNLVWRVPDEDDAVLLERLAADGLELSSPAQKVYDQTLHPNAQMLDVRMLFSTLVDADFLDTARHFGEERPIPPPLQPERALQVLQEHVQELNERTDAAPQVRQMRRMLWEDCMNAAEGAPGIFTLTAPTGAGKTLAMLGFALKHAAMHGLRRVVVVIPYLSIIEQTAKVYRDLLEPYFGDGYVIEHHSLAGTRQMDRGESDHQDETDKARIERLLAENWDAPLIVTTSVQMLESLFANTPSACRKLHRLARSVILFDEVQTLPTSLVVPTLQALSRLADRYGSTVVFATATQPAFDHLHDKVQVPGNRGWQPHEIVRGHARLFHLARRVRVEMPDDGSPLSWDQLAQQMLAHEQALCVLNIKRHAAQLARLLVQQTDSESVYHLSTSMCPAHRQRVLETVRARLQHGQRCLLVSTQCVEAGVDVDFPVVYRAFAPLDSIAQAAGRCNRNGKLPQGKVVLFVPEEDTYPRGAYEQAAKVTRGYLKEQAGAIDLYDPAFYDRYYRMLYDMTKPENQRQDLQQSIDVRDFPEVARLYRLIPESSINILVPYDPAVYEPLAEEARRRGLSSAWIRRARAHVVSMYRPRPSDTVMSFLEPVPIHGQPTDEWFIYIEPSHYDPLLGLQPQQAPELWIL